MQILRGYADGAERLGVQAFESIEQLLATIDAASVVTPTSTHLEVGKHLLQGGNVVDVTLTEDGAPTQLSYLQQPRVRPGVISTDEYGNLGFAQLYIQAPRLDIRRAAGLRHRLDGAKRIAALGDRCGGA